MSDYEIKITSHLNSQIKKRFSTVRKSVKNKIAALSKDPFQGEPLKYDLVGLRSVKVKRNYILIYTICKECRDKEISQNVNCASCNEVADKTIVCFLVGPHDDAYKIADKILQGKLSD